jgi:hypothetical protein
VTRRLSLAIAMIVIPVCLWPVTAFANWQYTKWGMSPEQVVSASHGIATVTSDQERRSNDPVGSTDTTLLSAPYQSGSYKFTAYFYFSKESRLSFVELHLVSGDSNSLIGSLRNKYGNPTSEDNSSVLTSLSWDVGPDLIWVDKIGDSPNGTSVGYKPRMDQDNKGL